MLPAPVTLAPPLPPIGTPRRSPADIAHDAWVEICEAMGPDPDEDAISAAIKAADEVHARWGR
jgi:hypothetical protein